MLCRTLKEVIIGMSLYINTQQPEVVKWMKTLNSTVMSLWVGASVEEGTLSSVYFILRASRRFNLNVRYVVLSSSSLYDNKIKWNDTAHGYI